MTIEESIAKATAKKLRIANLYEGTDGTWRCALYRKPDDSPTKWLSGAGTGPAEAIETAMAKPIAPPKPLAETLFEDLLG